MEKSLERESDQYRWSWQAVRKSNIKAVRMVGIVRRRGRHTGVELGWV